MGRDERRRSSSDDAYTPFRNGGAEISGARLIAGSGEGVGGIDFSLCVQVRFGSTRNANTALTSGLSSIDFSLCVQVSLTQLGINASEIFLTLTTKISSLASVGGFK